MDYQNDDRVLAVASEATELEVRAESITIVDTDSDESAKVVLSQLATKKKDLETLRKSFVGPLNKHVKDINTFFKEQALPLDNADKIIRNKVASYFLEQKAIADKEQERQDKLAAKRQETADRKAQKDGQIVAPPVPVPIVQTPTKTTKTVAGSVTMKSVWKYEIVDRSKIPSEFYVLEESLIRRQIAAGRHEIPGIRIYETKETMVRT